MSNTVSNIILAAIFGAMGVWLLRGYFKTNGKIKYKDKRWNGYRIVFLFAGIMVMLTVFMYHTLWDWIRIIAMVLCIIGFLLLRDGIGDEGVSSVGRFVPWSEIHAYDFQRQKKKFNCYFEGKDAKNGDGFFITITFDASDEEEIKTYLKKMIGKKYTRMKKD